MAAENYREVVTGSFAGMGDPVLGTELRTFDEHRAELVGRSAGKYALVHETDIAGAFDTEHDAIAEGYRRYGNIAFLVKQIAAVDIPKQFVSNSASECRPSRIEAPLQGQGIQGLIGRDALAHAVLVYIGYADQFTIAV